MLCLHRGQTLLAAAKLPVRAYHVLLALSAALLGRLMIAVDVELLSPVGDHEEVIVGGHLLSLLAPIRYNVARSGASKMILRRGRNLLQLF